LIWADNVGGAGSPSADDIITHITRGFNDKQLTAITKVGRTDDIPAKCPQNFNLFSECYAGLSFEYLPSGPTDTHPTNYTILGDGGYGYINAIAHTGDYELYVLPLQWAVDQVM
jgi:ATP-binding cassette subfamily A (ABC1) protein 3